MNKYRNKNIEVLISAMHLTDLEIIVKTKINSDALIINQSNKEAYIEDELRGHRIRCISTTERGLSKSRNLAIERASGDFCLICDDDEVLEENYPEVILAAFEKHQDAGIICFQVEFGGKKYSERPYRINYINSLKVSSVQMVIRPDVIKQLGIRFDERFGSGTRIGSGEENIFLYDCLRKNVKIYYEPYCIARISTHVSQWFRGFDENYFYNRGVIIRRLMGFVPGIAYCIYFIVTKYKLYKKTTSFTKATQNIMKGFLAEGREYA